MISIKAHCIILNILLLSCFTVTLSAQNTTKSRKNVAEKSSTKQSSSTHNLKGKVIDDKDNKGIAFSVVHIVELRRTVACDIDGNFNIYRIPKGKYTLKIRSLGYAPRTLSILIDKENYTVIPLSASSYKLNEVVVMADKGTTSKMTIGQEALSYLQPLTLVDALVLLPGNVHLDNTMMSFRMSSSRQASGDNTSSLGMGYVIDGAPVSNDGHRTQMVGVTDKTSFNHSSDDAVNSVGTNLGIDMRTISVDHIQSVEITRGISSAKYGNLSSGLVKVKSKQGTSPLNVRVRTDIRNVLAYVGKGFKLSDKLGTLHTGIDYIAAGNDPRMATQSYNRFTGQTFYKNQVKFNDMTLDFDARLNQTITVNKKKYTQIMQRMDERYRGDFKRTNFVAKALLRTNKSWIDQLEFITSFDYVNEHISRRRKINLNFAFFVPTRPDAGESEGVIRGGEYHCEYTIENKPITSWSQLNGRSAFELNETFSIDLLYGLEFNHTKNYGAGTILADETYPPYPYGRRYMRHRPHYSIPAMQRGVGYGEINFRAKSEQSLLDLSLGARATKMFNLEQGYALSDKIIHEPRINLSYELTTGDWKNRVRVGYGMECKLPTLDYLYPDPIHTCYPVLHQQWGGEKRLIVNTKIFDIVNKNIIENRNRKIEIGWDIEYKGINLSITAFREKMKDGYAYYDTYKPYTLDLYHKIKPDVDTKAKRLPQKEDFIKEEQSAFFSIPKIENIEDIVKEGIEYRITFPRIDALNTKIEINGAYYKTLQCVSQMEYYYPDKIINGKRQPYVALYDNDPKIDRHRFNSNFWFNTHVPKFGVVFSNFIQVVWYNMGQPYSRLTEYPYAYMSYDEKKIVVTPDMHYKFEDTTDFFASLKQQYTPYSYMRDSRPIDMLWNAKATKEMGNVKLSFYVKSILELAPKYKKKGVKSSRQWHAPAFGLEMVIKL